MKIILNYRRDIYVNGFTEHIWAAKKIKKKLVKLVKFGLKKFVKFLYASGNGKYMRSVCYLLKQKFQII